LSEKDRDALIERFQKRRKQGELSTDQLLNAIYLTRHGFNMGDGQEGLDALSNTIWKPLSGSA